MANEEKKVSFSASDNGVSSFIKRLQADTKQLFSDFAREAEKQSKSQKEQLKLIEQQIAAMERQNKLEREQNRLILERKKEMGLINEKAYSKAIGQMRDDDRVGSLQFRMLADILQNQKDKQKPEEEKKESMFNAVLGASIFRDLMGLIRQLPNAKTDVDLISPFSSMVGGGIGGGIGLLAGYNAAAGATIGKEIGGFVGDAVTRHMNESFKFQTSEMGVMGRTGRSRDPKTGRALIAGNLSAFGLDWNETANIELMLANAKGVGESNGGRIKNIAMLHRAANLDLGMLTGYEGMSSRMGVGGMSSLQVVAEGMKRGINQSSLPMLFTNMSSMVQLMGATTTGNVDRAAMSMLMSFNGVGGAFHLRDPRSMGLISTIQQNITNPSTPFGQALGYSVLRGNNPNASFLDLMIQRQQGGSEYAGQLINSVRGMFGGNENLGVPMLANLLGLQGNLSAARDLFNSSTFTGQGMGLSINGKTSEDISNEFVKNLQAKAEELTPEVDRIQASITNAFIKGADDGIFQVTSLFYDRMTTVIEKIADEQIGRLKRSMFGGTKTPEKRGVAH